MIIKKNEPILGETSAFILTRCPRGVRVTAKERGAVPASRVLRLKEWDNYLSTVSEASLDGACVMDFGVGVFRK